MGKTYAVLGKRYFTMEIIRTHGNSLTPDQRNYQLCRQFKREIDTKEIAQLLNSIVPD